MNQSTSEMDELQTDLVSPEDGARWVRCSAGHWGHAFEAVSMAVKVKVGKLTDAGPSIDAGTWLAGYCRNLTTDTEGFGFLLVFSIDLSRISIVVLVEVNYGEIRVVL